MIVVTGGAGFIGSVLVRELNKIGKEDIIILDRLRDTSKWLNLRNSKFTDYIFADDLSHPEIAKIISQAEFIFHIGACSSTTQKNMDYLMQNNVAYSKRLFQLATDNNIPIIYASSAATYGDGKHGYDDDHNNIDELMPLNPYGYSKQLFDQWVLKQTRRPGIWFGLKYFNVYGPNEYHKDNMRSLVHKSFEQIKSSGKVELFKSHRKDFKDGKQLRDFVYVKDIVRAMIQMMDLSDTRLSGIYNLGSGTANSFIDLVKITFKSMDKKENIEYIDMPVEIRDQYQYYTKANMEKFYKLLPEFNFSSLEEGVSDYIKSYLLNSNPYYK